MFTSVLKIQRIKIPDQLYRNQFMNNLSFKLCKIFTMTQKDPNIYIKK